MAIKGNAINRKTILVAMQHLDSFLDGRSSYQGTPVYAGNLEVAELLTEEFGDHVSDSDFQRVSNGLERLAESKHLDRVYLPRDLRRKNLTGNNFFGQIPDRAYRITDKGRSYKYPAKIEE